MYVLFTGGHLYVVHKACHYSYFYILSMRLKIKFIYQFETANILLLFIANIAICIPYCLVNIFHVNIALYRDA